jgi:MFS family permease
VAGRPQEDIAVNRYRALLATPGARAPLILSTLGSMPIGMYGLALLLLVHGTTGSFAQAGRVAGAFSLANAFGAVAQGRLMDRLGQTRVLRAAATGHFPALVALVAVAHAGAGAWALSIIALAGGATLPQLPAAMRSLWTALVDEPERRATAYALGAVVFELAVVTSPAIVAGIVAVASAGLALVLAGALASASAAGFTLTHGSRAWWGEAHGTWLGPLAASGMRSVFAVLAVFGAAVGVVQVAVPAFAQARGSAAAGGVLLAALSAGSMAGGLVYGARGWPGTLGTRLAALMLALGAAFCVLTLANTDPELAALLLLCGALFAPTVVVGSTLLDTVAPAGMVTEAFAMLVMGIVAGTAVGNALGGSLVQAWSYDAAVLTAGAVAAAGAALATARRRTLSAPSA